MKLDTRKKEYKQRLESYLINSISDEYFSYTYPTFNTFTSREKINLLFEDMRNTYNHDYNLKKYPSEQMRLSDYLNCGVSNILLPIYNFDILTLVAQLHNVSVEEMPTKTQDIVLKNFHNIIALSLLRLEQKLNKNN
jgi:hypothetical protein